MTDPNIKDAERLRDRQAEEGLLPVPGLSNIDFSSLNRLAQQVAPIKPTPEGCWCCSSDTIHDTRTVYAKRFKGITYADHNQRVEVHDVIPLTLLVCERCHARNNPTSWFSRQSIWLTLGVFFGGLISPWFMTSLADLLPHPWGLIPMFSIAALCLGTIAIDLGLAQLRARRLFKHHPMGAQLHLLAYEPTGEQGEPPHIFYTRVLKEHDGSRLKEQAERVLHVLRREDVTPHLIELLGHPHATRPALDLLVHHRASEAREAIEALLEHRSEPLRELASKALKQLSR